MDRREQVDKPILTDREAAEYLGFQTQTLAVWRMKGKGPAYIKCGRSIRYRVSDLERWLSERTVNHVR